MLVQALKDVEVHLARGEVDRVTVKRIRELWNRSGRAPTVPSSQIGGVQRVAVARVLNALGDDCVVHYEDKES